MCSGQSLLLWIVFLTLNKTIAGCWARAAIDAYKELHREQTEATNALETLKAIDPILDHAMDLVDRLDREGEKYASPMIRLAQVQLMVREAINA